jgi:hypothetical protein
MSDSATVIRDILTDRVMTLGADTVLGRIALRAKAEGSFDTLTKMLESNGLDAEVAKVKWLTDGLTIRAEKVGA